MPTTPADRLRAAMADALDQYERDTTPTTDDTDYDDPLSRSYLRYLAKHLERSRRGAIDPGNLAALIAADFDLADVRILRTAAEAVAAATPDIVLRHTAQGMTVPGIARGIGLTESRVYGIIREARKSGWVEDFKGQISNVQDPSAVDAYLKGVRAAQGDDSKD